MKRRKIYLLILPTIAFALVVFASTRAATAPMPTPLACVGGSKPIMRVVSRDHAITIVSTMAGPRYSATTHAGAVLAEGLTLEQLRNSRPVLYQELSPAVAGTDALIGPIGSIDLGD